MPYFAYDFTGDGWPDEWCATGNNGDGPGVLFVNPRGEPRRWDRYEVTPDVWIEETQMADVDGDGKPELVMGIPGGTIVLARPDPAAPTQPWKLTPVTLLLDHSGRHGLALWATMGRCFQGMLAMRRGRQRRD